MFKKNKKRTIGFVNKINECRLIVSERYYYAISYGTCIATILFCRDGLSVARRSHRFRLAVCAIHVYPVFGSYTRPSTRGLPPPTGHPIHQPLTLILGAANLRSRSHCRVNINGSQNEDAFIFYSTRTTLFKPCFMFILGSKSL